MEKHLEKKENKNPLEDVSVELNKLAELLDKATSIMNKTREEAESNYKYFKTLMESTHEQDEVISEDGVLEKQTNEAMKHLINSSKVLEMPINALVKVLTTKMQSDAIKNAGQNSGVVKPIDIDSFK